MKCSEPVASNTRSSAVSQILRKISADFENAADWEISAADQTLHYQLRVATDREMRARAYALAHRVYHDSGLAGECDELIVSPFDAVPQTLTILAQDQHGRDAGTITVVVDSAAGLPADEIYGDELDGLRRSGRLAAEVTRLAIDPEHKHSRLLLVRLFNFVYVYARRVIGADDFVIEVHPRHANYYNRLLQFKQIGPVKPCPRVRNSLSVLLRLMFAESDRELRRFGATRSLPPCRSARSLYPEFYTWLEEGALAEFLARQQRPMTTGEMSAFGLELPQCDAAKSSVAVHS